ncbi:hypothetical protein [Mesorhizobium sp.]|uniref:amino acid kinase family protein n=1 Tax=Mesorhizobium sp. TaxID=1871066 RepID=UPI00257CA554|nr:hypothetical protein [Mesorhizobium sp.]
MVNANVLVLLSNIDGLFTEDPHDNPLARLREVRCITPEIEAMAGHSHACHSSGGMVTKLMAARIAMDAGSACSLREGTRLTRSPPSRTVRHPRRSFRYATNRATREEH